jgi:rhodanese-related sulfurtransferase
VVVLDVREPEYAAGHLPGALNVPPTSCSSAAHLLRTSRSCAYCRGPFCITSDDAVGPSGGRRDALRLVDGYPEWAAAACRREGERVSSSTALDSPRDPSLAPRALDREALQRRSLGCCSPARRFGAGLAAGVTVGALLAEDVLGTTVSPGCPSALFTLGSAGAPWLSAPCPTASGRRPGLAGGTSPVRPAAPSSLSQPSSTAPGCCSPSIYGARHRHNLIARVRRRRPSPRQSVADGDQHDTSSPRPSAQSQDPNLVAPIGRLAERNGIPALAGRSSSPRSLCARAVVLLIWLRPDPLLVARTLAAESHADSTEGSATKPTVVDMAAVCVGGLTMVLTQLVMVAVMTMTPVHMRDHGHGLGATGWYRTAHRSDVPCPPPYGTARRPLRQHPVASRRRRPPRRRAARCDAPSDRSRCWQLPSCCSDWLETSAARRHHTRRQRRSHRRTSEDPGPPRRRSRARRHHRRTVQWLIVAATSYPTLAILGGVLALVVLAVAPPPRATAGRRMSREVEVTRTRATATKLRYVVSC